MKRFYVLFAFITLLLQSNSTNAQCTSCDPTVTTFVVDLSAASDTVWSTSSTRSGHCCGATGSTNCVRFEVTVSPNTTEIGFDVTKPAPTGGAFYQVDCGPPTSLGTPLCVTGMTSFCITFCKSGGDSPTYTISASQSFAASPDVAINSNCSTNLTVTGLATSSIAWNSIAPGASGTYNSYLSCTAGCDTTTVTPQPGYPAYIDYEVTGTPVGCAAGTSRDTVRVYINNGITASISPNPAYVCFGSSNAVITANATGGAPPYSYSWSTGATTQSITVGAGTYWVDVSDTTTGCPASSDTVVVTNSAGPITANAGTDQIVCSTSPGVTLAGAITEAVGGVWSGGTGTFSPNDSTLNATYTPSAAEISAGTVTLTLTSYGNGGCTGASDAMIITIQQAPTANAGTNIGICQGQTASLSGTVTGGAGTGIWTSSGSGTFSPSASTLNATYTPSAADITAGNVTLTLSATNSCSPSSSQITLTITPTITVAAGADQLICQGSTVSLGGSVTGGTTTGTWTTSGSGTFSNPNALNATYTPSAADATAGSVTLTLTSTNNGGCSAVTDFLIVTIQQNPTAVAGSNIAICQGTPVNLSGTVTGGAGTGTWTTSGTGTFSPSVTTLNATYNPSAADISSGGATLTLTATNSCSPSSSQLTLSITPTITVNAGANQSICEGNTVTLAGSVTGGTTTGTWTTSGSGTFSSPTALNATYTPSAADVSAGSVTLTLTSTNNGNCSAVTSNMTVTITPLPVVNAGVDQNVCESSVITLAGSVTVGSTTGTWTTSGTGTFSPNASTLNATYNPSAADVSAGTVTLTLTSTGGCQNVSDVMIINITPIITVNAGPNQTICQGNTVTLAGSVTGGTTTGTWTTSGSGTFSSPTALNATYTPSAADASAGSVTLTLTSTNNGNCSAVTSNMTVTITPLPVVNAGVDQNVCESSVITLAGSVTVGSTTGTWTTSGTGTFSPNASTLNATYNPSAADVSAGTVTLTLTSTGGCQNVSDVMVINITPIITVSAGANQSICQGNTVTLAGSVTGGTTTGTWTTSGSGTFSSPTALNATYTPSAADASAGGVTLTLTSTNNGNCSAVTSNMTVTISPLPVVNAGVDQNVCESSIITLNGSVTVGSTTGTWTTSGTGTFSPNASTLNATYNPSAADVSAGTVTLTLTSTGGCQNVSDQMIINITPIITVSAGANQSICQGNTVTLAGSVTGGTTTGTWTSSGSGTFSSPTALNATYTPSAADVSAGSVTLTLTSTNNGNCSAVTSNMTVTITPLPVVNAGVDQNVCESSVITLAGSVTVGSTTGTWSTSGTGTFSPNASTLNATYNPSAADVSAGTVTLTLTSTGGCQNVSDQMIINITPIITVSAGANQSICQGNTVTLAGSVTGGTTTGTWTSSGSGTFSSPTALNATYTPSSADNTNGTVTLTLTSTNNGNCGAVTDNMIVTISPVPVVNAGVDQNVCESSVITLAGSVTVGSTTGTWTTSGTGTFSPNASTLNATYYPSAADVSAGTVTLTLTSTGGCQNVSDQMIINITPIITVNAGANQNICEGNTVTLAGSVTGGTTTGAWTTSGSGTFSSPTALNATYTPSAADVSAGTVTLTLTSTNNGNCSAVTSNMTVTITPLPVVNAGVDQNVCESSVITLAGSVTVGSTTGTWTTSGTGTFSPNASTLNATYNPSATDVSAGTVTLTLTSTGGCQNVSDVMIVNITPIITVNAGVDQLLCIGSPVSLNGSITGGTTTGTWTTSGSGTFSSPTALNATYTPSSADNTSGSVTLTLTSTNNGNCGAVTDSMIVNIQPNPTASAGANIAICEGDPVNLSGLITGGAGTGIWTTSGSGTFSPSATDFNATYTPSAADVASGNVTLTISATNSCAPISDQLILNITPTIVVNAGVDQNICEGNNVTLAGSVTGGSTNGTWTTNGSGTLSSATAFNATYTPSAADVTNGTVTFVLTSTNNGNCNPVTDTMLVTITPLPVVNAGVDQNICQGNAASLSGSVTVGSTTGTWTTSGSGTFSPSVSDLNASYTPSAADISAGSVTLTLTSTGGCQNITDQLIITITPLPVVNAGANQTVCSNNADVSLSGSVTVGGSAGTWTTSGTGTFSPSASTLNATYTPSAADTAAGTVDLTLTSTDGCAAVSDVMTVTITNSPIVDAGPDLTLCANNSVSMNGSVSGPTTTGTWSTSGTGTFTSNTALNAIYTPSAADTTAGSVNITLTSTNNGSCSAVTDQLVITITPAPNVNAGLDQTVCENNSIVSLSGSVTAGATTGIWTTSGNGTFSPSNTDFNAQYTPGSNDVLNGSATLTLTSTNNGNCIAVSDQVIITVTPAPVVNAGADQIVCDNSPNVNLSGSVTGGSTTGTWVSSGTGTFSPSNTDLNATYAPSAADISNGNLTIVLQSTNNGNCNMVSDTMLVTITSAPVVSAGTNVIMCANNVVNLSGQVTGFTTTGSWTTSGTGTFSPSATDLNATYIPSSADTTNGNVAITLTSTNNSSCIAVSDNMTINFTPAPIVNAGSDAIICSNNLVANLSGNVAGASTTGIWTTSGTGTFSNDTDLNAVYTLSSGDTTNGGAQLILSATNIGNCLAVSDTLNLTLIAPPSVFAGNDQFVCLGNTAPLSGVITNGSGTGIWTTSGTGTFAPTDTDLNATYTPSAADESSGSVNLILTSTNNGNCLAVEDTLVLTFVTQPTVNAGADFTICSSDSAQLNGIVSGSSTTGIWSTSGDGAFYPSDTNLNAMYIPGTNDIVNGTVTLTLESTNSCYNNDQVIVTINPGPTVNAGPDQTICNTDTQVMLSGTVGGITTTGNWSSSGTGSFTPASTDLNATYNLTSADSAAGQFYLILTTTGNGVCSAAFDSVAVTMTTIPVVNAGADTTFCANNMGILNGSVTGGASAGIWTTSGTGIFAPSDTDLNATYLPSDADTTNGSVTLTLTSTGACVDITDNVILTITPGPIAFAGNDTTICNSATLQLSGQVSGASTTGEWFTSGDGTFSPSSTDLNAIYTPGTNDITNGNFDLYLSPTNIGDCSPIEDTMIVSIQFPPTATAGNNVVSCGGTQVAITGNISGGATGSWATTGSGTFSNGNLNTNYVPSTADTSAGSVQLILSSDPAGLCGQDSDTLTVFFMTNPVVNAGADQSVCANNDSTFISGMTSNNSGIWSTNGDGAFAQPDSMLTNVYIPGTNDQANGSIELYLTSANTQNCPTVTDTLLVSLTPSPLVNAGANISVCTNNLLVSLSGSVSGGSTTGYWSTTGTGTFIPDSLSLGTNYQPSISDTTNGSIDFILTSTNNGNCFAASDTLTVTFDNAPGVNAGSDLSVCQSDTAILSANVNGGGVVTWTTNGNGTIIPVNDTLSLYAPDLSDTIVPFEAFASYTNGCGTVTDTIILTVLPSPGLSTTYSINCATFEVQFDATTTSGSIGSINWDFGDGNTDTISSPMNQYATDGIYSVNVNVTTVDGCMDQSTFNVNIIPLPIADFIPSDTVVNTGQSIFFNDTSQNAVSWTWEFGDGTGSYNIVDSIGDTTYIYNNAGTYNVVLTVSNQLGCTDSTQATIVVNVGETTPNNVVMPPAIPNAFSPNNDNRNDVLYVRGGPFINFDFKIFNEWGNLIFSSDDQSKGWNGYYKNKLQPVGVYIYTFEGVDADGNEYSLSGDVTLIR